MSLWCVCVCLSVCVCGGGGGLDDCDQLSNVVFGSASEIPKKCLQQTGAYLAMQFCSKNNRTPIVNCGHGEASTITCVVVSVLL